MQGVQASSLDLAERRACQATDFFNLNISPVLLLALLVSLLLTVLHLRKRGEGILCLFGGSTIQYLVLTGGTWHFLFSPYR